MIQISFMHKKMPASAGIPDWIDIAISWFSLRNARIPC